MEVLVGLLLLATLLCLYFLPSIIAANRKHHQVWPIVVINFFFGWTFIGWVIALAMAVSHVANHDEQRGHRRNV